MVGKFVDSVNDIVKDALEEGAECQLAQYANGVSASITHNGNTMTATGNEMFVKTMLSAFRYAVISCITESKEDKQQHNVIDGTAVLANRLVSKKS